MFLGGENPRVLLPQEVALKDMGTCGASIPRERFRGLYLPQYAVNTGIVSVLYKREIVTERK